MSLKYLSEELSIFLKGGIMKNRAFLLIFSLSLIGTNLFAWELNGAVGAFFTPLGEVGYFSSMNPVYFGVGYGIIPSLKDEDWWDLTFRFGGTYIFKIGIGILGGLQYKLLAVDSMGGLVSYSGSSGYSGTVNWEYTSIFMPEIGLSYQWKKLYGNVMFQFDTVNIKNSTICFALGYRYGK
jgi:hypothetical protein